MKLHANASSVSESAAANGRSRTPAKLDHPGCGAGGGVSERTCAKWVARYRAEGELGLLDRSSAPERWLTAPMSSASGDRGAAALALQRPGDRRGARDAALDGLGRLDADRDGPARAAGPGAGRALRARAPWRADPHRRQETRPHPGRRRSTHHRRRQRTGATPHRRGRRAASAGTSCTSPSTTPPAWPTPKSCPTRKPPRRSASCAARSRSSPRHGITVERLITDNGPAYRSTVHAIACRALGIRHLRTRPPPTDQRQGRALHPHDARRLGLRRALPHQPRTHRSP